MPSIRSPALSGRFASAPTSAVQCSDGQAGALVERHLVDRERRLEAGQVVGTVEREVRPVAHLQVGHLVVDVGVLGADHDEHPRCDRPGAVVDDPGPLEDAAVLGEGEGLVQGRHRRRRAVHAAVAHLEAGGVGQRRHLDHRLGPVDEAGQHLRVHALGRACGGQRLRGRVRVERVVLALPGADDLEVQVPGEVDQDLGLDRLVAPAHRVDRPGLLGEPGQVGARSSRRTRRSGWRCPCPTASASTADPGAHVGDAGGLDDDVERQAAELVDAARGRRCRRSRSPGSRRPRRWRPTA